jgi:hypothetical protein
MNEEIERIIEESRKLLTRPWEEVKKEIQKRQALGKLPYKPGIFPQPEPEEENKKLPPAKPQI